MKKKLSILLIVATFVVALGQPSTTNAEERFPKITSSPLTQYLVLDN